jgi:hypothetical protein
MATREEELNQIQEHAQIIQNAIPECEDVGKAMIEVARELTHRFNTTPWQKFRDRLIQSFKFLAGEINKQLNFIPTGNLVRLEHRIAEGIKCCESCSYHNRNREEFQCLMKAKGVKIVGPISIDGKLYLGEGGRIVQKDE